MAFSSSCSFFDIEPLDGGEICRRAMDACSLCRKRLAGDRDIFMYRGDTPFCSEECRYRQMVRDDAAVGRNRHMKAKERPARKEQQRHRHETPAAAEPARVPLAANVPVAI